MANALFCTVKAVKTNASSCEPSPEMAGVIQALRTLRLPFMPLEADIHARVAQLLGERELPFIHEAPIGPRCRVDFLIGTTAVEIKKGKPNAKVLLAQLTRYAACDGVSGIVVLTGRGVHLPEQVLGKPVRLVPLESLWGVALS